MRYAQARCRVGEGLARAQRRRRAARAQRRREARGTKTTQVNAHMATVGHDRQGQANH